MSVKRGQGQSSQVSRALVRASLREVGRVMSKAVRKYVKDPERIECGAKTSDGDPCKNAPMLGGKRCRMHGGAAPQVKRKAQERLLDGVPKMLRMLKELASNEDVPPQVRLAAIRDWLDRAGIDRKIEIEVKSSSFEEMVMGVLAEVSEDVAIANGQDYSSRFDNGNVVAGELATSTPDDSDRAPLPTPSPPTAPYRAAERR